LLYEEAMKLARDGHKVSEIAKELERNLGERLDISQISQWVNRGTSPYGRVTRFEPRALPELAFLIGVKLGDGSLSRNWHHNYMTKMRVTDKDFAEEFARCAGLVLKHQPYKLWWNPRRKMWHVEINSIMLYNFLRHPFEEMKPFLNHCKTCSAAFLRGFFDSEGSSSGGDVTCSNTNLDLLKYVKRLLGTAFSIRTTNPHKYGPAPGSKVIIKGKLWNVNKQSYVLRVRSGDKARFATAVGFTISRKQRGIWLS
jgi:intein-encoded DNA endonuclease-like protein